MPAATSTIHGNAGSSDLSRSRSTGTEPRSDVIIWGSRTKRQGRGFVVKPCPMCGTEQAHFVAESKTKFTLYFVPTFTYATKAFLICTQCERQEEVEGSSAQQFLGAAMSQERVVEELQRRQAAARAARSGNARPEEPGGQLHSLAVGLIVSGLSVALVDRRVDQNEAAAIEISLRTIAQSTRSTVVRSVAALALDDLERLLAWISSPATGPLSLMLAEAGTIARRLSESDRLRYLGQLSWLSQSVAISSRVPGEAAVSDAEFAAMDESLVTMGFTPLDSVAALEYCDQNGG